MQSDPLLAAVAEMRAAHDEVRACSIDALTHRTAHTPNSGDLGHHHGVPATIIVSTTRQDRESAAGGAVTAGGSVLRMREAIRLASHAHHYLAVFDTHTQKSCTADAVGESPPPRRIVLLAR